MLLSSLQVILEHNQHSEKISIMKPTLPLLFLTRDIVQDAVDGELSALRLYDTLFILRGSDELIYPLKLIGRLYLNMMGVIPNVQAKLTLTDPDGEEMGEGQLLTGTNIQGDVGMNVVCRVWPVVFTKAGKYKIDLRLSTDGGVNFIDLESPLYFQVIKQT
jgi:hypothetical protein